LTVFGSDVLQLEAQPGPDRIWVTLTYEKGRMATLNLMRGIDEFYHLTLCGSTQAISATIDPHGKMYEQTLRYLLTRFLEGDTDAAPFEDAVKGIAILDAIEKSIERKRPVTLAEIGCHEI
jgi:predicted dehydrogenase